MNHKIKKIVTAIVFTIVVILLPCCSAEHHLAKAINKGAKIEKEIVTIEVTDTVTINGSDSIITREVQVPCPDIEVPKTKWEVRFDNKRFRDSLKYMRKMNKDLYAHEIKTLKLEKKMLSDSLDEVRKMNKVNKKTEKAISRHENRRSLWLLWMIIGSILTLGVIYVLRRFKKLIFPEN